MSEHIYKYKLDKEQGVVLLTGLIFLVVLTMIVLSVLRSATLEERMASNARNRQLALQASEAILRNAESTLFLSAPFSPFNPDGFTASCTNGLCSKPATGATPRWKDSSLFTRDFSTSTANLSGLNSQPKYFVELMGYEGGQAQLICPKILYRISARGVGMDSSTVLLQSYYRHRPAKFSDGSCG